MNPIDPNDYLRMSFEQLPETLKATLQNVEKHLWSSMDGFVEIITAWQRGGERVLSQAEVFALLGSQ